MSGRGREMWRAARAGVLAACAYALEMWLDLRIVRYRFNDFTLLGRPFSSRKGIWLPVGAVVHVTNGGLIGVVYAYSRRYLPGPGWLRGVVFAQAENLLLWPMMLIVDRVHPARREGELAPAWAWKSYFVAVLRHIAYGLVLGWLYRPDGDRP